MVCQWEPGDKEPIPMPDWIERKEQEKFRWENGTKHTEVEEGPTLPNYQPMVARPGFLGSSSKAWVLGVVAPNHIYNGNAGVDGEGFKWRMALKILDCEKAGIKVKDALKEVDAMALLVHHHIVSYVASYNSKVSLGIIMYPATRYNLQTYMKEITEELEKQENKNIFGHLGEELERRQNLLFKFFGCISQAVCYLHRTTEDEMIDHKTWGIKHKDIKPQNILVDDFDSPLLTDFGLSQVHNLKDGIAESDGETGKTEKYAPPEAFDIELKRFGYLWDIFSLGCVYLEMMTVALGVSLDAMHRYRSPGDPKRFYKETIDSTAAWLNEELPARARARVAGREQKRVDMVDLGITVLPVISKMMAANQSERCGVESAFLWQKFNFLHSDHCNHCDAQHEEREKSRSRNHSRNSTAKNPGTPARDTTAGAERELDTRFSQASFKPYRSRSKLEMAFDCENGQMPHPLAVPTLAAQVDDLIASITINQDPQPEQEIVVDKTRDTELTRPNEGTSPIYVEFRGPRVLWYRPDERTFTIVRSDQLESELPDVIKEDYPISRPWRGKIRIIKGGILLVELDVFKNLRKRDIVRLFTGKINRALVLGSTNDPRKETATSQEGPPAGDGTASAG